MKILVCEDNSLVTRVIQHKLIKDNYEIDFAVDGNQAVELLHSVDYDLMITDILIPFIGGLELINIARNVLHLTIPIIVLSAMDDEDSILKALKIGADDYITKPFDTQELSVRVQKYLNKKL